MLTDVNLSRVSDSRLFQQAARDRTRTMLQNVRMSLQGPSTRTQSDSPSSIALRSSFSAAAGTYLSRSHALSLAWTNYLEKRTHILHWIRQHVGGLERANKRRRTALPLTTMATRLPSVVDSILRLSADAMIVVAGGSYGSGKSMNRSQSSLRCIDRAL